MSYTSLQAARTARAENKAEAHRALLVWQDSVLDAIELLCSQVGVGTGDVTVVFEATDGSGDDIEQFIESGGEMRDELCAAVFASTQGKVTLTPAHGSKWKWAAAVELWDELRAATSQVYGTEIPVGIILDLGERVLYGYEAWYCPDLGADPEVILELESSTAPPLDPFAALMRAAESDMVDLDLRLEATLNRFDLKPPSSVGHEPGTC